MAATQAAKTQEIEMKYTDNNVMFFDSAALNAAIAERTNSLQTQNTETSVAVMESCTTSKGAKIGTLAGAGAWGYLWFGMNAMKFSFVQVSVFSALTNEKLMQANIPDFTMNFEWYATIGLAMAVTASVSTIIGALIGSWFDK